MKRWLKRRLRTATWNRLAARKRRIRNGVAAGIGLALSEPLVHVPTPVRTYALNRLRDNPKPLDFTGSTIKINVESLIEWDMRRTPCRKEPETVAWLQRTLCPGDLLFDVGANVGTYTLIAAAIEPTLRVIGFEPGAATYRSLCRNVLLNELAGRVTPVAMALSDEEGLVRFGLAAADSGAAGHGGLQEATDNDTAVTAMRMDAFREVFSLPCPTHIKIDVDGSEHLVIEGARNTLREPGVRTLLVEVDVKSSRVDLVTPVLEDLGFRLVLDQRHADSTTHNLIFDRVPVSGGDAPYDEGGEALT